MNSPGSNNPTGGDDALVEPERSMPGGVQPEEINTHEILKITESIPVTESADDAPGDSPSESAMEPVVPPQGFNVLAIVSLVLALTASPLTVIFGYLAVGQVRRAHQRGEALAWVAVGLGWLWLVAWIVLGVSLATIWFEL